MSVQIKDCIFEDNAENGVYSESGDLQLEKSRFIGNGQNGLKLVVPENINLDDDTRQLLSELVAQLDRKNPKLVVKIFNKIADKSLDLAVAIIAHSLTKP